MCISFQYHYTLLQSITKFFNKKVCLYLPWIKTNNYTKGIILFLLAYFYIFLMPTTIFFRYIILVVPKTNNYTLGNIKIIETNMKMQILFPFLDISNLFVYCYLWQCNERVNSVVIFQQLSVRLQRFGYWQRRHFLHRAGQSPGGTGEGTHVCTTYSTSPLKLDIRFIFYHCVYLIRVACFWLIYIIYQLNRRHDWLFWSHGKNINIKYHFWYCILMNQKCFPACISTENLKPWFVVYWFACNSPLF